MPESDKPSDDERCRYCDRTLDAADPGHAENWPFCSGRCRMAELGKWLEGKYVISRPLDQVADDAAPPSGSSGGGDETPRESE